MWGSAQNTLEKCGVPRKIRWKNVIRLILLQRGLSLIPVEVKAGNSVRGKSLGVYVDRFRPEVAVRYSMKNLRRDGGVLNIPLFMADWTEKLLGLS